MLLNARNRHLGSGAFRSVEREKSQGHTFGGQSGSAANRIVPCRIGARGFAVWRGRRNDQFRQLRPHRRTKRWHVWRFWLCQMMEIPIELIDETAAVVWRRWPVNWRVNAANMERCHATEEAFQASQDRWLQHSQQTNT